MAMKSSEAQPEPKKKFNKRAQNIKYEGEKQNTLEGIPAFIRLSWSQDRRLPRAPTQDATPIEEAMKSPTG